MLLTGATGFLAKAFLEKTLRSVDTIGGIYVLVRPRPDGTSAKRRLTREVLRSKAFDRLRASLGSRFETLCEEKIHVVQGDLTKDRLGLTDADYEDLTKRLTLVINSAATVTFDEQIDLAVELNTLGPTRLLQLARDCGGVGLMHVSTCYVSGIRKGLVVEDFSAPPGALDKLPKIAGSDKYDLDALVASIKADAEAIKAKCRDEAEEQRRLLIDAGMKWARDHGWNDTYTFTKWIGEQYLLRDHGDIPAVVFRPAIIEGSFEEPTPGWIDGLRMADPIIVAYGKGRINEFPARSDLPIDFIPADFVVNAMFAALPIGREVDSLELYQCCSSERSPLYIGELRKYMQSAFRLRPMNDENGKPIRVGTMQIVPRESFIKKWQRKQKVLNWLRKFFESFKRNSKRARRFANAARKIDQLVYFAKIYSPYTNLDCQFSDANLVTLATKLHPDDVVEFPFDPAVVSWRDYIVNRHIPGLRSYVLGTAHEPTRLAAAPEKQVEPSTGQSLEAENLFQVLEKAAKLHPDRPALQIRRKNRWLRYTYKEALEATGAIMARLQERGLTPGDRVAISSENCPEWGLTYFAIMRAGMTAVPLDPQLLAADAWSSARYADAKIMCAGKTTIDELRAARDESSDAELIELCEPFIPAPGASRDSLPEPVVVDDNDLASILFTSGTTVAAKAVRLTHANLLANASALIRTHKVFSTDQFLSVLPLYHAFEFTGGFLVPLSSGATITYIERLKGPEVVNAMKATGTTVMLVVPRLLKLFGDSIHQKIASSGFWSRTALGLLGWFSDLTGGRYARKLFKPIHEGFGGCLRMFVSGGSRLDPEILRDFDRMGFPIYEGYGLTETSPVLTVNPPGDYRPGSVGIPLSNIEIEIRNKNLESVGEVWAKGPSIMAGYLGNPEATREVIVDGWFRTGDLGRVDEDGYLYLTGRSKDLIITSAGKNVYPDEVELRYCDLPFVKEMCVLALPAEDGLGDAVHAVVVLDYDADPTLDRSSIEREIREAAATISESLPSHQRIASLHFWEDELPKTSTLKAKRGEIRNRLVNETRDAVQETDPSSADKPGESSAKQDATSTESWTALRGIIASQSGRPEDTIRPQLNLLLDLGIDSIGKIDLIGQVEGCFNVKVSNEQASSVARVADLVAIVGKAKPTASYVKRDPAAWQRRIASSEPVKKLDVKLPAPLLPLRWGIRSSLYAFMHSYIRVRAEGCENIPSKGGFVLAPNHCSHLDSPSVLTAVGNRRRVWIAGAQDYFFGTWFKRFLFGRILDTIPFDRKTDGLQGLQRCGEAIRKGDGLLLFPEGTRSTTGQLQPFKIGIAVLAMERNVPIIPVHIDRAYELFRKGYKIVRPGRITVRFGKPIRPPKLKENDDHYEVFRKLAQETRDSIVELSTRD